MIRRHSATSIRDRGNGLHKVRMYGGRSLSAFLASSLGSFGFGLAMGLSLPVEGVEIVPQAMRQLKHIAFVVYVRNPLRVGNAGKFLL